MPVQFSCRIFLSALIMVSTAVAIGHADDEKTEGPTISQNRTPWTTSKITGSPEPPHPYTTERAFSSLQFDHCLDIAFEPGSDRLFVAEQSGKIFSFPNQDDTEDKDLVIDFAKAIPGANNVYAFTFHPNYEENRYCYVCYIEGQAVEDGTHVARFEVSRTNPPTIDPKSEKTIITWLSGGHNGCCLKFGPDGYLYISTGDAEVPSPPDPLRTGQDISDLLSSILRIDVDNADEGKGYRIPADNPFVELEGARGEIWAYGLRNPWRMSFDRKTGDLWVGDVGWELWELMQRIERGGNYGWSVMEGLQPTNPEWPQGPTTILPPFLVHPHSESSSITDGLTYYGNKLPDLQGVHVYGDYDTGKIWGFRLQDGKAVDHRELADTTHRIVGFGEDHADELLYLDHIGGSIHRLVPNPGKNTASNFPRDLASSGLFSDPKKQQPAPGVIPYSINAEAWADHAIARRFVAVPNDGSIRTRNKWQFPDDTVFVKTLSLELRHGDAGSRRRIETQILHFDGLDWQPYTYEWNNEQTNATLVSAAGAERQFEVLDASAPEGKRMQTWRFSGRGECQRCHNRWAGHVLGFHERQLQRTQEFDGIAKPQMETLLNIGLLKGRSRDTRPNPSNAMSNPLDSTAKLNDRARAYLHVNCSHCHRDGAGGAVLTKLHDDLPLRKMDIVGARPTQGTFAIPSAQVVAAGDPYRSVLFYRMSKLGTGRMPHIGSSEIDRAGLRLIHDWILKIDDLATTENDDLTNDSSDDRNDDSRAIMATLRAETAKSIDQLRNLGSGNADQAEQEKLVSHLLSSTSNALQLATSVDRQAISPETLTELLEQTTVHENPSVRDLFERFLPAEKRVKRLGSEIDPDQLLALPGNAETGRRLFFNNSNVQCKNCHRIEKEGKVIGPDLTDIGKKSNRAQILESILEPSKIIEAKYLLHMLETSEGKIVSGILQSQDEQQVILKDAQGNVLKVQREDIERMAPQRQSLMPELQLRDMTAQQVADLLAFLESLK